MSSEQHPKVEIAHVLTMDVVQYSTLLITEQTRLMGELTSIVKNTQRFQRGESEKKLVRIPTGDGMALVFFDDPQAPMECATEIATAMKEHPEIWLRMGIHSGPVNLVVDVSERANVAGAGIDVAQRVMDCGDAGHILLSKRVADDVAPFPRWNPHLHELGECEVKHGRKISLVNFYTDEIGNPNLPRKFRAQRRPAARAAPARLVIMIVSAALFIIGFVIRTLKFSGPTATRRAAVSANAKSIAVLPFENLSHDSENAYFAEGIQEEILNRLSRIGDLKVISRTSTQRYKSAPANLSEIANQLGVAHILEGTVQKAADQVRVSVQLINAQTDSNIWAEKFDRELTDIFSVESEIAKTIAETLQAKLTASEQRAIDVRPTESSEAHQLYLKGRFFWSKRTTADLKKSIDYFNQAIEKDPNYALAYAGLADAWLVLPLFGGDAPKDCSPKAEAAARRAIHLDETLADPHASLGLLLAIYYFDCSASIRELERAIQLNPNYAMAPHWLGNLPLTFIGQFDRAIGELKRALELDPLSMIINANLGQTYYCSRRYEEAIAQLRGALEIDPGFYYAHYQLGQALELKGDHDAAIAEYQKAGELNDDPSVQALLAHAMAKSGNQAQARNVLERLIETSHDRYVSAYGIGLIYLGLGENEEAVRWFEKSYDDRDGTEIGYIKVHPFLDPLRGDPRFEKLANQIVPPDAK
jgi:TolB-like protein/Tfp pilus assembly protein PilF